MDDRPIYVVVGNWREAGDDRRRIAVAAEEPNKYLFLEVSPNQPMNIFNQGFRSTDIREVIKQRNKLNEHYKMPMGSDESKFIVGILLDKG